MRRNLLSLALGLVLSLSLLGLANAKTLRLAMDADPVSMDPHVQLSGGMLQS